jgi:ribosomal protein L30/L7E
MSDERPLEPLHNRLTLTETERQSGVWSKIDAHLRTRLQKLRERNDSVLPESETAKVRGQIQEVKELLLIGNSKPQQ